MIRQWAITTDMGTFHFVAESKVLAHDHATMLRDDPTFTARYGRVFVSDNLNEKVRHLGVRFTRWVNQ
jgi:hypothetical protein